MIDKERFREVMGHFASGVTVVTTRDQEKRPVGLTVSAFTSVSLEPTLLLICVHTEAGPHDAIIQRGTFAVNILSAHQGLLATHFAEGTARERYPGAGGDGWPLGESADSRCSRLAGVPASGGLAGGGPFCDPGRGPGLRGSSRGPPSIFPG